VGTVVCATRGGEASRRTQERAIALARERGDRLIFLCAFDPTFAGPLDDALAAAVADEQRWLGRALLGIAQARARRKGLETEAVVRSGPVTERIREYLGEVEADTLVIGVSKSPGSLPSFDSGRVHDFAERMRQEMGVEVVIVTAEE
jgi:nucleotide-binding universal stress UspA family protein